MLKGVVYALSACLIWGLIFVIPLFMEGFSPIEIALGRYFFYGALSSLIFIRGRWMGAFRFPISTWKKAFAYSFAATIGYYIFFVLSLRFATPAITALILGISPIAIALLGNWKEKEISYKTLIFPSLLLFTGLVIINFPHFTANDSLQLFLLGLICCLGALFSWSWYVVANSRFLKNNPEVPSGDWSTAIGVATLFWVALLGIFWACTQTSFEKFSSFTPVLTSFLIGSAALGILCSWVGAFLWNRACLYLSVSAAGQMTIFETIFGLIFVCILEKRLPPKLEFLGICLILSSIILALSKMKPAVARIKEEKN